MEVKFYKCYSGKLDLSNKQFYVEIYDKVGCTSHYWITCSFTYDLFKDELLRELVAKATKIKISQEERDNYVRKLLFAIKSIPDIEKYYSPSFDELTSEKLVRQMTPYSAIHNSKVFNDVNRILHHSYRNFECYEISQNEFESVLINNSPLQFAYVDVYFSGGEYYYFRFIGNQLFSDFYLFAKNQDAVFYFFKNILYKNQSNS